MAEEDLILSQSEYEHLLEEIHRLQARISELTALRDDLLYHVCPALQAEYDEKIVSLERELMAANMYLNQMQRTIEILQAQMNQQQEPSMEKAQAQAKQENKEYEDELNRKAKEAREFKKKWEESQWSKHDRQEKEQQEKEKQEEERQEKETGKGEDRHSAGDDRDGHKAGQDETVGEMMRPATKKAAVRITPTPEMTGQAHLIEGRAPAGRKKRIRSRIRSNDYIGRSSSVCIRTYIRILRSMKKSYGTSR